MDQNIEDLKDYIKLLEKRLNDAENKQLAGNGTLRDESLSASFFNNIPIGIVIVEFKGSKTIFDNKILSVNSSFERITGIKGEQILGVDLTQILDKDQVKSEMLNNIFNNNEKHSFQTNLKDSDKHYHISLFKLNEDNLAITFNDNTKLKEAENTILFERNLFQTLLNKFPDAIYFKDSQARFLRASLHLTHVFKTTPNEIIGKTDFDFYKKPLADKKFADDMKVIKTGMPIINKEEKGDTDDDNEIWYSTTKLPLFDRKGEIYGMFGISRDITDKKNAERKEKEYKNNLISLTDSVLELLKVDSKEKIFIHLCQKLESRFKHSLVLYAINNGRGLSGFSAYDKEESKDLMSVLNNNNSLGDIINNSIVKEIFSKGKIVSCNRDYKECFKSEDVNEVFNKYEIKHKYLFGITEGDKILGIIAIFMKNGIRLSDKNFVETFVQQTSLIFHRKNLEDQLIIEKERAEESDKLKTSFLANLSHEIRTPINAIQGFGELLKIEDLPLEKKTEYVDIIQEKSGQLIQIIADIIDISKFESNQVKVNVSQENLNEFLSKIIGDFEFRLHNYIKKDIPLHLELALSNSESIVQTDFALVKQVISNLISNSIKFTHKGVIELGYKIEDKDLVFYVHDTGIGIPKDKREIIFARFRQVDESRTRKYGGTGIGLTISRSIADLMDGKIWVENAKPENFKRKEIVEIIKNALLPGEMLGSSFYFKIPFQPVVPKEPEHIEERNLDWRNKNIMVVEDDSFNYQYISEVLSVNEPKISHCKNGQEAVDYFAENQQTIDIILMDLQMPVMDGYEATKKIRMHDDKIPIIVQTAYSMPEDIKKAKDCGATDFIIKPYVTNDLLDKISRYL